MQTHFSPFKIATAIALAISSLSISTAIFAVPAPVYDADDEVGVQDNSYGDYNPANDTFNPAPSGPKPVEALSPDQRLQRVEGQIKSLQSGESNERLEALQTQIQALQGNVDQLTRQVQILMSQQKNTELPVEKPLVPAAAAVPAKVSIPAREVKVKPKSAEPIKEAKPIRDTSLEEQQVYQKAYNFIKAKNYKEAVDALQEMLRKYPSGQFASNAHYWLGELYGLLNKHDLALAQFITVLKQYPDSPRVSDAQLKVGLIYAAQFKWNEAKSSFKKVISAYPGTASARLASQQLKQIQQAGH